MAGTRTSHFIILANLWDWYIFLFLCVSKQKFNEVKPIVWAMLTTSGKGRILQLILQQRGFELHGPTFRGFVSIVSSTVLHNPWIRDVNLQMYTEEHGYKGLRISYTDFWQRRVGGPNHHPTLPCSGVTCIWWQSLWFLTAPQWLSWKYNLPVPLLRIYSQRKKSSG